MRNKIVSKNKIDELEKSADILGPLYLIDIDIKQLDDKLLNYSLYDVIFLPELIKKFILLPNNKHVLIISELSGIINKNKRNFEKYFDDLEKEINIMNNYFVYFENIKYTLKDIWDVIYWYCDDNQNYLSILKNISFFKHFIEIITKLFVYSSINGKIVIYKNKKETINNINFNNYYKWLSSYKYINQLFIEFQNCIQNNFFKL